MRIDLTHQQLRRGDILVLCTDGLSGLVKKEEIAEVVTGTDDLVDACRQLIDRANENGGPDNITAIVAKIDGSGLQPAGAGDRLGHAVYPLPGSTPQGGIVAPGGADDADVPAHLSRVGSELGNCRGAERHA